KWKDASSIMLLESIIKMAANKGFSIEWVDAVVILEKPKLLPHIASIKTNIARAGIPADCINIKAKTNEGMGFTGRGEGIAAQAVCTLKAI
ncbi:2-C-methyl-D-erythritol 2,4-cyclodiphosphate synthase, partial [bacterium]|nr:2-C-methyl-D-erythritol 2,4-cyclodiphosphate synthase [bacterium]